MDKSRRAGFGARTARIVILTGARRATVQDVAVAAGIAGVPAEALPDQEMETIARLQREGRRVGLAGAPLASGVLYPAFGLLSLPTFGAVAMTLISQSVRGNVVRLRWPDP